MSGSCVRLKFARSHPARSLVFANPRPISLFFLFHLIELLFGRVLASVCEAQLCLCVN